MTRLADIFSDPLIPHDERSLTAILWEDFGVSHRKAGDGRQALIGRDGEVIGNFNIIEATRWVVDQRRAA